MSDNEGPGDARWSSRPAPPTVKERNAVQRSVERLLDALAPETALRRGERPSMEIQPHRTPSGCVLQAADVALSVSWFAGATEDATLGEIQVVLWRGTVARRGLAVPAVNATVGGELVLHPIVGPEGEPLWKATDGRTFDSDALAAHCFALLEEMRT
jgi:hypothetical protein